MNNIVFIELLEYRKLRDYISKLKSEVITDFNNRTEMISICLQNNVIKLKKSTLLFNLIIFQFHIKHKLDFYDYNLMKSNFLQSDVLVKHFNSMITRYTDSFIGIEQVREDIVSILNELSELSAAINNKNGQTISLLDFIKASQDPKIRDVFYPELKFGMSFSDVENKFKNNGNKLVEYYKNKPESEVFLMAASDCGMNAQQLAQVASFVGTKPDISGNIIPYVVKNNYLMGLKEKEEIFISAKGCRKATIFGKTNVKKSGYLTQKLSLGLIDVYNDDTTEDCGTEYLVNFEIEDKKVLKSIIGRHYYLLDQNTLEVTSDIKTISGGEEFLIGLIIGLRSPITCRGKHICDTCYGKHLAKVNRGRHTGLIAVYDLTNPLTQMMLSVKHLLKTDSSPLDWGILYNVLISNMEKFYVDETVEFKIILNAPTDEQYDYEDDMYFFKNFKIEYDGEVVDYEAPEDLYINPELLQKLWDGNEDSQIIITDAHSQDWTFMYYVKNNELLKSLQNIVDLIENNDHLGCTNYHEMANMFIKLCVQNNVKIMSVHLEMIIKALLFEANKDDNLDFNKTNIMPDDYRILRVSAAVMKGPLSTSLMFERIPEQLSDINTYQKTKKSISDRIYL